MDNPIDPLLQEFFVVGTKLAVNRRLKAPPAKIALLAGRYATLRRSIIALAAPAQSKKVASPTPSPNAAALIKAVVRSMPPRPQITEVPNVRRWLSSLKA